VRAVRAYAILVTVVATLLSVNVVDWASRAYFANYIWDFVSGTKHFGLLVNESYCDQKPRFEGLIFERPVVSYTSEEIWKSPFVNAKPFLRNTSMEGQALLLLRRNCGFVSARTATAARVLLRANQNKVSY
jgi:hypothetical protein